MAKFNKNAISRRLKKKHESYANTDRHAKGVPGFLNQSEIERGKKKAKE